MADATPRGMTVAQFAAAYRLGEDRARQLIRCGELGAINVGTADRPRLVILPRHAAEFEAARAVAPPRPGRRRKPAGVDYYPPAGRGDLGR